MGGPLVEVFGRAGLADRAVAHDHDAVRHRQRLVLVVGDIDGGRADGVVDAADLGPHLEPELGVEVRQRLVHQHHGRADHDGARNGDALLLAARHLAGQPVGLRGQPDQRQRLVDAPLGLAARHASHGEPEPDVASRAHVREQGVALKHHAEAAVLGRQFVDALAPERDAAAAERHEAGNAVQRRGLAAARRAEQGHELAGLDREVDALQRREPAEVAAEPAEPQGFAFGRRAGHDGLAHGCRHLHCHRLSPCRHRCAGPRARKP